MAFVNLSLLAGGLFVGIPVVLHLIMRQRPKPMVFPALRFIHQRRIANQRRLQLRHWLLLALRCGAIGLAAAALARPSVASAALSGWLTAALLTISAVVAVTAAGAAAARGVSRPVIGGFAFIAAVLLLAAIFVAGRAWAGKSPVVGDQEAPVAAVLVIDTAPRMQYRHENQTRLAAAQKMAQWLIRQLPADSEIAVVDSRPGSGAFAVDRAAAAKSIDRLRPAGTPRPLLEVIEASVALVKQKSQARKEVYVVTDLSKSAWTVPAGGDLAKVLGQNEEILIYIVDVGVDRPRNFSLDELQLSNDVLTGGAELVIETQIRASGVSGERTVELVIEKPDPTLPIIRDGKPVLPQPVRRGSQTAKLAAGASQRIRFAVHGLEPGTHQGLVRLVGEDGLALDDVRFFAVEVQPAWPVLVVSPSEVSPRYLIEALAPRGLRETGQARFACTVIEQSRLSSQPLEDYRAIALVDPAPVTPEIWQKLAQFVEGGGGLAVFFGHRAQPPSSFQDSAAVAVLGGKLTRQTRTAGDVYFAPRSYDHPVMQVFRQYATSVPWDRFPVYYHWNVEDVGGTSRSIIPYGDGKPALIENRLGRGSVLVMTTPISDPARPVGRPAWNELATGEDAWPCFVLVNEMFVYLVKSSQTRLNLQAGEAAHLPNDPAVYPDRYQLFTPLDQPQEVAARDGRLTVRFTDNPGAYRLRGQKGEAIVRGFAVNLPADSSDLSRLESLRLDELLGKGRYQLAKSREEIDRAVGNDRIGSEFYPLLVVLLAAALGFEQVLANRFYRADE